MIKFRLYIPPVILGFVIVPLLVWPTVIVLAVLIFTLTFLAEIIFSFPLLVVRISLQELQLELMVEYALFFSVMAGIGWQFGNDSNLLIVFYVQIMPDDFVMQLHRF
ncbi:membrane protein [Escherichia coli]|nr:membrane protein [Escherichia coli]